MPIGLLRKRRLLSQRSFTCLLLSHRAFGCLTLNALLVRLVHTCEGVVSDLAVQILDAGLCLWSLLCSFELLTHLDQIGVL